MPPVASRHHIRAERQRYRRAQDGRAWSVKDLPKYYYHRNFCEIIDSVEAELGHLLGKPGLRFLKDFRNLPFPAQCAYARLCGRKGQVFNIDKFDYPEIEALSYQYERLAIDGFVAPLSANHFENYLCSLTKQELLLVLTKHVCGTKFKKSWKKDKLINIGVDEIEFDDLNLPGNVWVQSRTDALEYILFLHSGQVENSLQNLTLRDLGLVKAPKLEQKYGAQFANRETAKTALFYATALRDFRQMNTARLASLTETIDSWPNPLCAISVGNRDKLLHKLGGFLERKGEIDTALSAYSRSDTSLCNERVIRLRYKKGDKSWVKSRLEDMIENPSSDDEHAFAQDFYARKYQKKRTSIVTDILREADTIELDEAFRNQPERAAMHHYRKQGLVCFQTENVPWQNLFGLLFWDELYKGKSPRNFPKALKFGTFYEKNKSRIERKLEDLDTPHLVTIQLLKTLTKHFGKHQNIVHWGSRSLDRIQALIESAPKGALAYMLRLMAKDWPRTKDGFPDLIVIEDGLCRFVEIKATGDIVRRNQLTRLRQLRSAGFNAEILKVNWTVDPDQTYVVVDVETTGGRAGLHRVTEIGAVKVKGGKVIDEWSSLINPQRSIPANITRITGITEEMVSDAPIFAQVANSFAKFMGDAIFAAHNVNFDYGFISAEFQMVDRHFSHPKICTCSSMRKLYPGHASYSLKNLCREFEIDLKSHHRALCDAKAAAELLFLVNEKRLENQR
ncbi:MAG: exonuclease domain-containing protein [Litorimonas sp.]